MTKPTKWSVRPAKTQIIWTSAKSDQNLRCPHKKVLGPWLPIECTAKTDQMGQMPRLMWVFAGRTCHFVGFVMLWLIYFFEWRFNRSMKQNIWAITQKRNFSVVRFVILQTGKYHKFEPPHNITNKMTCAHSEDPSAQSDQSLHCADSEDFDQTGWMPRLIWVVAGRTSHFVGFVVR